MKSIFHKMKQTQRRHPGDEFPRKEFLFKIYCTKLNLFLPYISTFHKERDILEPKHPLPFKANCVPTFSFIKRTLEGFSPHPPPKYLALSRVKQHLRSKFRQIISFWFLLAHKHTHKHKHFEIQKQVRTPEHKHKDIHKHAQGGHG